MICIFFLFLSCSQQTSMKQVETITDENNETVEAGEEIESEDGVEFMVIEHNKENDQWQLAVHSIENWSDEHRTQILTKTYPESIIRHKHDFLWLLERGGQPERIVQYDPNDLSEPKQEFVFSSNEIVYPNDITLCDDKVFVTLFESTDILVLDDSNFHEIARISLDNYADGDGKPEASTLMCKENYVFVSLHRIDRRDTPSVQLGSQWVVFDPNTYEEIAVFDDQGYRSDIIDIPKTPYVGSIIRPHIEVSGTPGFWIFDVLEEIYYSQIYFIYNDKTIFDTAIGNEKITHLATNYADEATWMFCHDFRPGETIPGYSYDELVPVLHSFVALTMNDADEVWLMLHSNDESNLQYTLLSIDPNTCMAIGSELQIGTNTITDIELVQKSEE